jgi:hypothetical protein
MDLSGFLFRYEVKTLTKRLRIPTLASPELPHAGTLACKRRFWFCGMPVAGAVHEA